MKTEVIQKLLYAGRRKHVIAAAKLGSRVARQELNIPTPKRKWRVDDITLILREAGFREDVADVMIAMSLLRTMLPMYFEVFELQAHTDLSSATKNVMSSLESWLRDPCPEATTQVFAQSIHLHRSFVAWHEAHADMEEDDDDEHVEDSGSSLTDSEFDDMAEKATTNPEDLLYAAIRATTRLTSPIERTLWGSEAQTIDGCLFAIEKLRQKMTPVHHRSDRIDTRSLFPTIQEGLIKELLKLD